MNFSTIAKECFQTLRSYDYEVQLFDDEGNIVYEPEEAFRMFAKPENIMVAIVDDGQSSAIRLYLSKNTETNEVMGLIQTLRTIATKYTLIFNVGRYDGKISPKKFATKVAVSEGKYKMKTVSVLGHSINKEAWDALKMNRIELNGRPKFKLDESYESRKEECAKKLEAIVPHVSDLSLQNLLAYVEENLLTETDADDARKMRTIAVSVIKASGARLDEGLSFNAPAVKDFGKWVKSFNIDNALNEDYRRRYTSDPTDSQWEDWAEDAMEEEASNFNVENYLQSKEAEDLGFPYEPDTIPLSYIAESINYYLSANIYNEYGDEVDMKGRDYGYRLAEKVRSHFEEAGFTIVDKVDENLTREDVLIPKNSSKDLENEVSSKDVDIDDAGKLKMVENNEHRFVYNKAENDSEDDEIMVVGGNREVSIQRTPYAGGYSINEFGYKDPDDKKSFYMKDHGTVRSLKAAKAKALKIADA